MKRRTKYAAVRTEVDGVVFASKREADRFQKLSALAKGGAISELRLQVPFDLHAANGKKVCRYVADFVFVRNGRTVVADAKGFCTEVYKLKRRWMKAEYDVEIMEL